MVRKCESFSFGAPTRRAGMHPSLLIIPYILGNVNNYFQFFSKTYPQVIHSLSTFLSTGALCARVQK